MKAFSRRKMFKNRKIVVVTPAGRQRYLELLIPQVYKLKEVVDEYHLWVNTDNPSDIDFLKEQEKKYSGFIKLIPCRISINRHWSIHSFFPDYIDKSSVYVRFDDDIVWLDNVDQFKKFLSFRIDNPQYFLVYANILNNAIITHIHQRFGNISLGNGMAEYGCLDKKGWGDEKFAVELHKEITNNNDFSKYRWSNNWILYLNERVSINAISWLGSEFAKFKGIVGDDEEQWLSVDKPLMEKKHNIIFGDFLVVHYAFCTQRNELDKTDTLIRYKKLLNL